MVSQCVCGSRSTMSDSLRPHGLGPARLLRPWDCPGQNTGVGSHFASPGYLPHPGIKPWSPALQADSLPSEALGKTMMVFTLPLKFRGKTGNYERH